MLQRNGMDVEVVAKYFEGHGTGEGTVVEMIRAGGIDLVINTPYGQSGPRVDGYEIRTAAVAADIPCITTVAGAAAAIQGIEALTRSDVGVAPLQVLHARMRSDRERQAG
jgi:carbamoyl-phosphate synthase large subunit